MYNYNKKLIIWFILFVLTFFCGFGFADDCSFNEIDFKPNLIFSQEDIELARSHLLNYCCKNKKLENGETFSSIKINIDKCKNTSIWPDSPYWYDHFVDIGIRKLSAREDDLYDGMKPDEDWKKWIEFIEDVERQKTPGLISKMYDEFWNVKYPIPDIFQNNFIRAYLNIKTDSFSNTGMNLYHKYANLCLIVSNMYQDIWLKSVVVFEQYWKCVNLVDSKINNEKIITNVLSQKFAANLLFDSFISYTDQFIQNRLMKLQDKIVDISSFFYIIGKQAPLEKNCNK